jgi:uncharacterized protein YegJ (DUF2314 family)
MQIAILTAAALVAVTAVPTLADSFSDKAANDKVATVSDADPAMARAVAMARKTLPDFLALATTPTPGTRAFSVKVGLGPKGAQEFFWLTPFSVKGDTLTGQLANKPDRLKDFHPGQSVTVKLAEVTDWMYFAGPRMRGNYSACALLTHEPPQARQDFEERYGADCHSP